MARDLRVVLNGICRLLAAISVLLGLGALASFAYEHYFAAASMNWPGTPGEFEEYEELVKHVSGRRKSGFHTTIVRERRTYYRYAVARRRYIGKRISFARSDRELLDRTFGRNVTVYYNPSWPAQSVLIRGPGDTPLVMVGLGIALIGTGFIIPKIGAKLTRQAYNY